MSVNRITGNTYIDGVLRALQMILSDGCVNDDAVAAGAAIQSTKLQHRHTKPVSQSGTAVAETRIAHVAQAAGTVIAFKVGAIVACTGDAVVGINLLKNGVSVLAGGVELSAATDPYELIAGTVVTDDYVAGDVFTVDIAVDAGTGTLAEGVCADTVFDEAAT